MDAVSFQQYLLLNSADNHQHSQLINFQSKNDHIFNTAMEWALEDYYYYNMNNGIEILIF
jgi:hypothetical protein